ncbi:hypothetical protein METBISCDRAFT_26102 [Metschnikowia bicuspidata]|uniref:Uncharacterized protein n=1 Tax=Metschnikowia bicuspidata TaxID=27322 RepID=A0A4P9ZFX3_9ASCO|nr:hypothetical protein METBISCDRAFT_26102 [Metschnikowia bicuspidata]
MFAKSATPATPVARPKTHINESVVWVNNWYTPHISSNTPELKLKGWSKKSSAEKEQTVLVASDEFIDIETAKYYQEPIATQVVQTKQTQSEAGNAELKQALSIDKKEDEISSLSGLGI